MSSSKYCIRLAETSDKTIWDSYVTKHPDSSPYHLFAWKEAVEEAYGHKGLYLIAENNNVIVGTLPLIHLNLPFLLNELVALPFCDVGNILCDNEKVFDALLTTASDLAKKFKPRNIHIRGQMREAESKHHILVPEKTDKVRMLFNLPPSSEVLMSSFKSKLRSQIRKAEKNGLTFQWRDSDGLDDYYKVFSLNMRDLGSPVHSIKWFKAILKYYSTNAQIGIVALDEKPVGSCIILSIGDKVSIPWASTLKAHNRLAPNMLLYWNVLKYSCEKGFREFDFGRSSLNEGTFRFKSQWGAQPVNLEWYSLGHSNSSVVKSNKNSKKREYVEKIWQNFPLVLANTLGPMVRKYISL